MEVEADVLISISFFILGRISSSLCHTGIPGIYSVCMHCHAKLDMYEKFQQETRTYFLL